MKKYLFLFALCICALLVKGQSNDRVVADLGLPLQLTPGADLGIQLKLYSVFDSSLSNTGPGAGCEFMFGDNNSGTTIGPKIFYQADFFMGKIAHGATSVYIVARVSGIRYTNSEGNDYRFAPEAGISLYDMFTVLYGYNFSMPFGPQNKLSEVYTSRITLVLTLGGKDKM